MAAAASDTELNLLNFKLLYTSRWDTQPVQMWSAHSSDRIWRSGAAQVAASSTDTMAAWVQQPLSTEALYQGSHWH